MYEPQLFPTVSRCTFKKKMGLWGFFFGKKMADWQFWHDHAGPLPTVSDCFRLFPTVSDCFRLFPTVSVSLERQLDLWTTDSTKITTFNTFPHDPSARRLLEMMHFDFETQYTLKIPKPQDLVKFNITRNSRNLMEFTGRYLLAIEHGYWKSQLFNGILRNVDSTFLDTKLERLIFKWVGLKNLNQCKQVFWETGKILFKLNGTVHTSWIDVAVMSRMSHNTTSRMDLCSSSWHSGFKSFTKEGIQEQQSSCDHVHLWHFRSETRDMLNMTSIEPILSNLVESKFFFSSGTCVGPIAMLDSSPTSAVMATTDGPTPDQIARAVHPEDVGLDIRFTLDLDDAEYRLEHTLPWLGIPLKNIHDSIYSIKVPLSHLLQPPLCQLARHWVSLDEPLETECRYMFIVMNRRVWDLIMGSVLGSDMTIDLVPDGTPPEMVKTSRLIVTLLPLTEMLDLMGRQHDTIRDLDSRLRAQQDQLARISDRSANLDRSGGGRLSDVYWMK